MDLAKYIVDSTRNLKGGHGRLLALPLFIITVFCFVLALWSGQPASKGATASKQPQSSKSSQAKLPEASTQTSDHLSEVSEPTANASASEQATPSSSTSAATNQPTPTANSSNSLTKQLKKLSGKSH